MEDDQRRSVIAQKLLIDREARYDIFPGEIFDEYAWNMLLHLFVATADRRIMTERDLIDLVHTSTNVGQRWLYLLAKDRQIEKRSAGDDVALTEDGLRRLRTYLDDVRLLE